MDMSSKGIKFILLFLLSVHSFCQTITCNLRDNDNNNIFLANILFKESSLPRDTKEYTIAENGSFSYRLKQGYNSLLIEIRANGFITKKITIENPTKGKEYKYSIILDKEKTILLDEVIIEGKKKFEIKNDTLTFNVDSYIDGSETKIEDVIKKLPGIDVDSKTGEIKYKGKSIETVMIEGDNLFDYNYTIGTKNINLDIVDKIQAIDNYSKNHLLKGIEQSRKTALNLTLKKDKSDLSGDLNLGNGLFNNKKLSSDYKANALSISKQFKSFGILSYNNVGKNNTPFDYFGVRFSAEQIKEEEFYSRKVIPENIFSNILNDDRNNINKQIFGNFNSIFKISEKVNIKSNLFYIDDKITNSQNFQRHYQFNGNDIITNDLTSIIKKPKQFRSDIELTYKLSNSALFEYTTRFVTEEIETSASTIQNNNTLFNSRLRSEDLYFRQKLLYTKRFTGNKALQVSFSQSINSLPQTYTLAPSIEENFERDIQKSKFKRNYLMTKVSFFGAEKKRNYNFSIGALIDRNPYSSELENFNNDNSETERIINDLDYNKSSIYQTGKYTFILGKWQILPYYSFSFLKQTLENNLETTKTESNNIFFEPAIEVNYSLSSASFLSGKFIYEQNTNPIQYLFYNPVLIDSRTTIKNVPELNFQKSQTYGLFYFNNDLYNQFEMNLGLAFSKQEGNFFSNSFISETLNQIEYFYSPQENTNLIANFQISKYIPILKTRIKLNSSYSMIEYQNIVNNSDLRKNKNYFYSHKLFFKTAFKTFVNFENTLNWYQSVSKNNQSKGFTNNSILNEFNFIIKPSKKWHMIFSYDYFLPDLNQQYNNFNFLDLTVRFNNDDRKIKPSLVFKNILNERNLEQINTSDISTSVFRTNLLNRYFLLNLTYRL